MQKRNGWFKRLGADMHRNYDLYLMAIPGIVFYVLFKYWPMYGVQIAFRNYNAALGITGSPWVGLKWFEKFIHSFQFGSLMSNTFLIAFYSLLVGFPIPIILALALNANEHPRFKKTVQMVSYAPHFISVVVLVGMMFQMFSARNGIYGAAIFRLTGTRPADPFATPGNFRHFYLWSGVWQDFGWGSIIYLAALAGVDPSLHEAATVDGASRFKRVLHVDLPTILPTIVIMLILRFGSIMSIGFEKVYLMQYPTNITVSEIISTHVYKVGMGSTSDMSYASAIGLFNSVINCIMLIFVNWLSKKVSKDEVSMF